MWELISNIILVISLLTLVALAGLGLYQWIKRKTIKKVDKELLWIPLPLTLMTITYIIFDKFLIWNTRPNGSGEASFPSSHVMVVATIFFIVIAILPKYIEKRSIRIAAEVAMVILILLTCLGRVFSNMHWASDVVGALIFAFIFTEIYDLIIERSNHAKHLHKNHKR